MEYRGVFRSLQALFTSCWTVGMSRKFPPNFIRVILKRGRCDHCPLPVVHKPQKRKQINSQTMYFASTNILNHLFLKVVGKIKASKLKCKYARPGYISLLKTTIIGKSNSRDLIGSAAMVYQPLYHAQIVASMKSSSSGRSCKMNSTKSNMMCPN